MTRQRTWLLVLGQAALQSLDARDALRQQLEAHTSQHLSTTTLAESGMLADRLALFTLFENVGRPLLHRHLHLHLHLLHLHLHLPPHPAYSTDSTLHTPPTPPSLLHSTYSTDSTFSNHPT